MIPQTSVSFKQITSAIPHFISIVQSVLGKAASTFKGVAQQNVNAGNHLVQSLDQHVQHADMIGDHLLAAGHTIDSKLEPLHKDDAQGVKGLINDLASSYGNGATSNPFVGAPMGLVGANEPVPSESIPQLAASIASLPSSDDHLLDTNRIFEGTKSGNAYAMTAIDKYLEMNPTNFGHAGFGVVTGNLGGSLGLGGIGGIDGGNALTVNETIKTKRNFHHSLKHHHRKLAIFNNLNGTIKGTRKFHPLRSRELFLDGRKHFKLLTKNRISTRKSIPGKLHLGRSEIYTNSKNKDLNDERQFFPPTRTGKKVNHSVLKVPTRSIIQNLHNRQIFKSSKQNMKVGKFKQRKHHIKRIKS